MRPKATSPARTSGTSQRGERPRRHARRDRPSRRTASRHCAVRARPGARAARDRRPGAPAASRTTRKWRPAAAQSVREARRTPEGLVNIKERQTGMQESASRVPPLLIALPAEPVEHAVDRGAAAGVSWTRTLRRGRSITKPLAAYPLRSAIVVRQSTRTRPRTRDVREWRRRRRAV